MSRRIRAKLASLVALATLVGSTASAGLAHADTLATVWDRARDPQVAARDALHGYVEQALSTSTLSSVPVLRASVLDHARDMLLEAHADTSRDPRLRFDLGEIYERLNQHERAATVLSRALKEFPDAPGSEGAIEMLSFAYAHLDRPHEERATYFTFLARVTDDYVKATATLNLAEAEMRLGNLPEAVARYRESVTLASSGANLTGTMETTLLATWGLAVALDRSGDPQAAEDAAKLGTQLDPGERTIAFGENVFFVPEYERHWYLGLGLAEEAKSAVEPHYIARYWEECEKHWAAYLKAAAPTDRWLPLARRHLDEAHARALEAHARVAEPQPRAPGKKKKGLPDPLPDPTYRN